jgi:hypothetical protein
VGALLEALAGFIAIRRRPVKNVIGKAFAISAFADAALAAMAMPASAATAGVQEARCPSADYPIPGNSPDVTTLCL